MLSPIVTKLFKHCLKWKYFPSLLNMSKACTVFNLLYFLYFALYLTQNVKLSKSESRYTTLNNINLLRTISFIISLIRCIGYAFRMLYLFIVPDLTMTILFSYYYQMTLLLIVSSPPCIQHQSSHCHLGLLCSYNK